MSVHDSATSVVLPFGCCRWMYPSWEERDFVNWLLLLKCLRLQAHLVDSFEQGWDCRWTYWDYLDQTSLRSDSFQVDTQIPCWYHKAQHPKSIGALLFFHLILGSLKYVNTFALCFFLSDVSFCQWNEKAIFWSFFYHLEKLVGAANNIIWTNDALLLLSILLKLDVLRNQGIIPLMLLLMSSFRLRWRQLKNLYSNPDPPPPQFILHCNTNTLYLWLLVCSPGFA